MRQYMAFGRTQSDARLLPAREGDSFLERRQDDLGEGNGSLPRRFPCHRRRQT